MDNFGFYDLFSTYQKDYVFHKQNSVKKEIVNVNGSHSLEKIKSVEKPLQIHLETLTPFKKDINIPCNLYFRSKDCVQTNPYDKILCSYTNLEDNKRLEFENKLKIRKIRPKIYMTPQICLDEIPDDIMYKENGIAENIYTTDWKKACKIVWPNYYQQKHPLKELKKFEDEKIKGSLEIDNSMKYISHKNSSNDEQLLIPQIEKYVTEWYEYQPRIYVDTTKLFWENKNKLCDKKVGNKDKNLQELEEMKKLAIEDKLRLAYSIKYSGYGGYIPKLPVGVKMKNKL